MVRYYPRTIRAKIVVPTSAKENVFISGALVDEVSEGEKTSLTVPVNERWWIVDIYLDSAVDSEIGDLLVKIIKNDRKPLLEFYANSQVRSLDTRVPPPILVFNGGDKLTVKGAPLKVPSSEKTVEIKMDVVIEDFSS